MAAGLSLSQLSALSPMPFKDHLPATMSSFRFFQRCGCYLDDLSHDPVDPRCRSKRSSELEGCVDGLAMRLRDLKPQRIIVFLKRIELLVLRAVSLAGISCDKLRALPFPGHSHQTRYVQELVIYLEAAKERGEFPV
ncbi:MAG: hypothetical protein ACJ8F7_02520 [Gemmataceae bacterium]